MSRRIEIEITSLNGETATWRAAGAKLPKGVLQSSLLPGGAVVGNVYRADVEQYMEGIEVLSLIAPKTASPIDPRHERLEMIAEVKSGPDVIVTYAPKGRGPKRDGGRDGGREGGRDGERRPRRENSSRPTARKDADGSKKPARERPARSTSDGGERAPRSGSRPARSERPRGPQEPVVSTVHRNALLATLSPEQLPVAEQLLRGGMPAVRTAVETQNKAATEQGRPTIDPTTIDRIAEDLLPRTTLATWKDRATSAIASGRETRLRDLRAVVTSAKTVTLDEDARLQLKELQGSLSARVDHLRTQWTEKLEAAITAGNVRECLTLVARPPDVSTRVSADVATRVVTLVSAFLNADQTPAVWNEIVEMAADTSIRRNIKPVGIPDDESSRAVAVRNAGAIPEFAKMMGMKVPPPPPPSRVTRRPATRRAS